MPQFIAVGSNGAVYTSPNGSGWIRRATPRTSSFAGVATNGSMSVVVGGNDSIRSTDGITWVDSALSPRLPMRLSWRSTQGWAINSEDKLVIISGSGSQTTFAEFAVTTDGLTWTSANSYEKNLIWTAVAAKDSVFVAVSSGSTAARSTDGYTWTRVSMPSSNYIAIKANANIFVAISTGTSTYATSTDGITWTSRTLPASAQWSSLWYGGNRFCMTSSNSTTGLSSTDGITWTTATLPATSGSGWHVVWWDGLKFFALRQQVSSITAYTTSTDGITWSQGTFNFNNGLNGIASNPSRTAYIATGITAANNIQSTDGVTWTGLGNFPSATSYIPLYYKGKFLIYTGGANSFSYLEGIYMLKNDLSMSYPGNMVGPAKVRYLNGQFIVLYSSIGSNAGLITSTDGVTWNEPVLVGTGFFPADIAYGNGVYHVCGTSGIIRQSTDLVTWTSVTSGTTNTFSGITYGNGRFVAVGSTSTFRYLLDGQTAYNTATAAIASRTMNSITWTGTQFVAVDNSGSVHRSLDGIGWTSTYTTPTSTALTSVTYAANLNEVVTVGGGNNIFSSTY